MGKNNIREKVRFYKALRVIESAFVMRRSPVRIRPGAFKFPGKNPGNRCKIRLCDGFRGSFSLRKNKYG